MRNPALVTAIAGMLLFAAYLSADRYATVRFAEHLEGCVDAQQLCRLAMQRAQAGIAGATIRASAACVRAKQSWVEQKLIPMNGPISDPSLLGLGYGTAVLMCNKV